MRGYSLVEVLVAMSLVVVGVAGLAQLVALTAYANLQATHTTIAAVLAQQKMEELLPAAAGELAPSPAGALGRNVEGCADFLDLAGQRLGGGPAPPAGTAYVRRWSIDPLTSASSRSWILQVVVTDLRGGGVARLVAARTDKVF